MIRIVHSIQRLSIAILTISDFKIVDRRNLYSRGFSNGERENRIEILEV